MKNLILIGNGFDISHGLNTKYEHFMYNYLTKCLINSVKNRTRENSRYYKYTYEDPLINIYYNKINKGHENRLIVDENYIIEFVSQFSSFNDLYNELRKQKMMFIDETKLSFLQRIIVPNMNWVDIENSYFRYLVDIWNHKQKKIVKPSYIDIVTLNEQFEYLKKELISYLKNLDVKLNFNSDEKLSFRSHINDLVFESLDEQNEIEETLILNFNYIDTFINNYKLSNNTKHISIHGDITSDLSDIVMGYGNDDDPVLNEMINDDSDEFFKFRKINNYTSEKKKGLDDFIKDSKFTIKIFCHSIGLTDKTLLKELFLNQNLYSICLHQHGDNREERKKRQLNQVQRITKICESRSNDVIKNIHSFNEMKYIPPPKFHNELLNSKYLKS